MRFRIRVLAALVALVVTAGACGGGAGGTSGEAGGADPTSESSASTTSAPAGQSAPPERTAPSAEPGAANPQPEAGASGGGEPSPSPPADPGDMEIDVQLAEPCVQAGGVQSLTATTRPGSAIAYGSTYSDGTTSFDDDFYGGSDSGFTDDSGRYTDRWTVGADAPSGKVVVDVQAVAPDGSAVAAAQATFQVVGLGELCP